MTGEFYQRDRTLHPPALTPGYKTSVKRSPQHALLSLQNSLSARSPDRSSGTAISGRSTTT